MSRYAGPAPRPLSKIAIIDQETIDIIAGQIPAPTVDISGKVDKVTGKSLVADTEIAKIHLPGSDNQDLSGLVGTTDYRLSDARTPVTHTHDYEPVNANIQIHVLSSHAPVNAQPNNISDVNAGLLTGGQQTTLHSHAGGSDPFIAKLVLGADKPTGANTGTATFFFRSETTAVTTCKANSIIRVMKV